MLRKRIKKKKPLLLITKQKLHSKSTYFYTKWFLNRKTQASDPANGFRVSLSSLRENSGFPVVPSAIQTRLSRKVKNPYGGITRLGSSYFLPVVCGAALLLVAGLAVNPFAQSGEEVYAVSGRSATINPTLSIEIDNGATMNPTYVTPGEVAYRSHIVKVSATDIMNYTLQLTAASGESTELKNGDASIPGTVAKVGKELAENTWGWSWSETNTDSSEQTYYALPAYGTTGGTIDTGMLESKQANEQNTVEFTKKLTFAANMGSDKPSGHYTTTAMLSLAATPKQLVFDGITTMQEMSSTICENAAVNDTTRLKDSRDGKYYWVAKLADNHCWMTQNLALDLTDITLTPEDSDVTENWTPNLVSGLWTAVADEENFIPTEEEIKSINYYNPGEVIWAEPRFPKNGADQCGMISKLEDCTKHVFKDVSELEASNTITTTVLDEQAGIYDAHYLVGNYYNANAATANTVLSTTVGEDIPASICPAGWGLPNTSVINGIADTYKDGPLSIFIGEPIYTVFDGVIGSSKIVQAGGLIGAIYLGSSLRSKSNIYVLMASGGSYVAGAPNSLMLESRQLPSQGYDVRCVVK